MDFSLPPEVEAYRSELAELISATVTPEIIDRQHATGTFDSPELNRALGSRGYLERALPGLGKGDPLELFVLFNELEKAAVPFDGLSLVLMVAGVIQHVGSSWHKDVVLPTLLSGDAAVCMGYSEPDHGSDLGGITTRAELDGDQWVINGAKMWTTMAHRARWLILLTRTNPDVSLRHRGLTMFLLPMATPGITVEPVHTMGTERTNATFYDDVRVGPECVLGEVNGGWRTMTVALSFERGVMGGTGQLVPLLRHVRQWAHDAGLIEDTVFRERYARAAIDAEVARLLTIRSAWIAASGGLPGLEGSMSKVFATEAYQRAAKHFQAMAGPTGLLQFHELGAAADGWIEYEARHSPVTTIYGGTSEINRNNVAERQLGLPKAR